jgi:hypothetical protein
VLFLYIVLKRVPKEAKIYADYFEEGYLGGFVRWQIK